MAEEAEVLEEIRDVLHQVAEQGERQTALLERMAERARKRERLQRLATLAGVCAVMIAVGAATASTYNCISKCPWPYRVAWWIPLVLYSAWGLWAGMEAYR